MINSLLLIRGDKRLNVFLVVLTLDKKYLKCLHCIGSNGALDC